jgi:hypothetical protein
MVFPKTDNPAMVVVSIEAGTHYRDSLGVEAIVNLSRQFISFAIALNEARSMRDIFVKIARQLEEVENEQPLEGSEG